MMRVGLAIAGVSLLVGVAGCQRKPDIVSVPPTPAPAPVPPPRRTTETERRARQPSRPPSQKPEPPKAPPLGAVLSVENREQLLKEIEGSLERAQRNIATLHSRPPTPEQTRGIGRVEAFIRQARDSQATGDLTGARSLAIRADLLSQDLL